MRERIEAYHELKYTALNCGIETDDIPFLVNYILADFEWKKQLRSSLVEKKSRVWAISIIAQLSKINPKALEVLESNISHFVWKKEIEARSQFDDFLNTLKTDDASKELLKNFIEDSNCKLLIIPLMPRFKEVACVSIDHYISASQYWLIERTHRVIKLFKENPKVFYASQWNFTVKEDTNITRYQIEQEPSETLH